MKSKNKKLIGNHQRKRLAARIHNKLYEERKIWEEGTFTQKAALFFKKQYMKLKGLL